MRNWIWPITIVALVIIVSITVLSWKQFDNPVVKLKEKEKIYDKESKQVKSEDIDALTINSATSIQLANIKLEEKKAELQAGVKKENPPSTKNVTKVVKVTEIVHQPNISPSPVVNNNWESPLKDLNNKVDQNQSENEKRFDKVEGDIKDLGNQVSDVNQGVNWLINQAQKPDKKTSEIIQQQQKQKVTNNTEE